MHENKYINLAIVILVSLLISFFIAEGISRLIEPKTVIKVDSGWKKDDLLGWIPLKGKIIEKTPEYVAVYEINSLGMNDREPEKGFNPGLRIMALGDSHTFAAGVSQKESWPNILEDILFNGDLKRGTVYNCAVSGYSLGQYLLRFRQLRDLLRPKIIIIGFSMATDLYDLIPPRLGGFVYGGDIGRAYFDLDQEGKLIEIKKLCGLSGKQLLKEIPNRYSLSFRIKRLLGKLALYRIFRRSKLAMWVAIHVRPGMQSLWPGLDSGLRKNLNEIDSYRWKLAEEIIKKIAQEAEVKNTKVILINIPYLAQVYDDIWESSYGMKPQEYDRYIAGRRLEKICERAGIYYIDITKEFVKEAKSRKAFLHYRYDGHPNAEGHKIIAKMLFDNLKSDNLIQD